MPLRGRRRSPVGASDRIATEHAHEKANRKQIAAAIAPRNFLNQPVEVLEQILTGVYPDGLGNTRTVPDRIDFDPFPYHSMAVWILTQMKRWGYVKGQARGSPRSSRSRFHGRAHGPS